MILQTLFARGELNIPFPSGVAGTEIDSETYNTELAAIIEEDPRLTAAVLRYANTAIYGGGFKFESVEDALLRLGYLRVKEILLACFVEGFYHQQPTPKALMALCRDIFDHSIGTAICCRDLVPLLNREFKPMTAFTAGLLHHLGLYLMLCRVDQLYENILQASQEQTSGNWLEAEELMLGSNHAEVGGMLLQLWELPDSLQLGVWMHHAPPQNSLAEIVRASSLIANTPSEHGEELEKRVCEEIPRLSGAWWQSNHPRILEIFESLGGLRGRLNQITPRI